MYSRHSMWHKKFYYVTLYSTDPELECGAQL